jgi:Tfp pilus assembly protein PilF
MTIVQNPFLQSARIEHIIAFFQGAHNYTTGLYTPMTYSLWLITAIISQIFFSHSDFSPYGLNPILFKNLNIILHVCVTMMVYRIILIFKKSMGRENQDTSNVIALIGALIFGLYPIQVETVTWISNMGTLLSSFLALSAFYLIIQSITKNKPIPILSSTILYILALAAKPQMVTFPLYVLLLMYAFYQKKSFRILKLTCFWIVISIIWIVITKINQPDELIESFPTLGQRFWIAADALGFYVKHIFLPYPLIPDHGRTPQVALATWNYGLTTILLTILSCVLFFKFKPSRFYIILVISSVCLLIPVLGLIPFSSQNFSTVAERYLYLSLFPIILILIKLISNYKTIYKYIFIIIPILGGYSAYQTTIWKSNYSLYHYVLTHNPKAFIFMNNLGMIYYKRGDFTKAQALLERAAKLKSNSRRYSGFIYRNLSQTYLAMNKNDQAKSALDQALAINSQDSETLLALASYEMKNGNINQAIEYHRQALACDPKNINVYNAFSTALINANLLNEAEKIARLAVEYFPNHPDSLNNLSVVFIKKREYSQALIYINRALNINPNHPGYISNRDFILKHLGQ